MEIRIPPELTEQLRNRSESFSQMLLRLITEREMTAAECYRKAGIDRRHFFKIRQDTNYRPRKRTVISFALALRLELDTTNRLLETAGFSLSPSSPEDIIVKYCIRNGNYDLFYVNELLHYYGFKPFGADIR